MAEILDVPEVKVSLYLHLTGLIREKGGSRPLLSKAAKKAFFLADNNSRHVSLLF